MRILYKIEFLAHSMSQKSSWRQDTENYADLQWLKLVTETLRICANLFHGFRYYSQSSAYLYCAPISPQDSVSPSFTSPLLIVLTSPSSADEPLRIYQLCSDSGAATFFFTSISVLFHTSLKMRFCSLSSVTQARRQSFLMLSLFSWRYVLASEGTSTLQ